MPSDEKATKRTESVCPARGPVTSSPAMAFHTQIVKSDEPETMHWPSGVLRHGRDVHPAWVKFYCGAGTKVMWGVLRCETKSTKCDLDSFW
jgi:hypothetical protein